MGPNHNRFVTPELSKLEKVVDTGSGPRGPLQKIGVHYLNFDFQGTNLGSGPRGLLPGSTTFSNVDGSGVMYVNCQITMFVLIMVFICLVPSLSKVLKTALCTL